MNKIEHVTSTVAAWGLGGVPGGSAKGAVVGVSAEGSGALPPLPIRTLES